MAGRWALGHLCTTTSLVVSRSLTFTDPMPGQGGSRVAGGQRGFIQNRCPKRVAFCIWAAGRRIRWRVLSLTIKTPEACGLPSHSAAVPAPHFLRHAAAPIFSFAALLRLRAQRLFAGRVWASLHLAIAFRHGIAPCSHSRIACMSSCAMAAFTPLLAPLFGRVLSSFALHVYLRIPWLRAA